MRLNYEDMVEIFAGALGIEEDDTVRYQKCEKSVENYINTFGGELEYMDEDMITVTLEAMAYAVAEFIN